MNVTVLVTNNDLSGLMLVAIHFIPSILPLSACHTYLPFLFPVVFPSFPYLVHSL